MTKFDKSHFLSYLITIPGIAGCMQPSLEKLLTMTCDIFIIDVLYINLVKRFGKKHLFKAKQYQ